MNPDRGAFYKRGGKLIVAIGTNDTLASPGAQLDYYQSVLDEMGRKKVDAFARFFVLSQTGHCLSGTSYSPQYWIILLLGAFTTTQQLQAAWER